MPTIGRSFNPANDDNGNGGPSRTQQAIQVLGLRLPKFVGARSPVPAALLSGQNAGGGQAINAVLASLLQQAVARPGVNPPPQVAVPRARPAAAPASGPIRRVPDQGGTQLAQQATSFSQRPRLPQFRLIDPIIDLPQSPPVSQPDPVQTQDGFNVFRSTQRSVRSPLLQR